MSCDDDEYEDDVDVVLCYSKLPTEANDSIVSAVCDNDGTARLHLFLPGTHVAIVQWYVQISFQREAVETRTILPWKRKLGENVAVKGLEIVRNSGTDQRPTALPRLQPPSQQGSRVVMC